MNDRNVLSFECLFESRHSKWLHLQGAYNSPWTRRFSEVCNNCMITGEFHTYNRESHGLWCHFVGKTGEIFWVFLPAATKLGQGNDFTGVCDSVHRGVCLSACWDATSPLEQTSLEHTPPWSRPPRPDPPGADTPQTRPPRGAETPLDQTPQEQTPPPPPEQNPQTRSPRIRHPLPRSRHQTPQEPTPSPLGVDTTPRGQTPPGADPPRSRPPWEQTHPGADASIRSMSGRYASYWNAFFLLVFIAIYKPKLGNQTSMKVKQYLFHKTSMHSSRMLTARLFGVVVCALGGGVCSRGSAPRGCLLGGDLLQGCLLWGGSCDLQGMLGYRPHPTMNRILDTRFRKYYLAPTSLRAVTMKNADLMWQDEL